MRRASFLRDLKFIAGLLGFLILGVSLVQANPNTNVQYGSGLAGGVSTTGGVAGQVAFFTGGTTIAGSAFMTFNSGTGALALNSDGSAAAPVLTFGTVPDLDTGIWHPAANTIGISAGGTDTVRVISGQVLINQATSPFGATAAIDATSTGTQANIAITAYNASATLAGVMTANHARGVIGAPVGLNSGDLMGRFQFAGYNTGSAGMVIRATLRALTTEAWTGAAANSGARLDFQTSANAVGTPTTRMVIDQNGFVGIGPDSTPDSFLAIQTDGTAALPAVTLGATTDPDTGWWHPAANTQAWSTAGVEAMRITSTQFVGIGATNPESFLEVSSDGAGYVAAQVAVYNAANFPFFLMVRGRGNRAAPTAVLSGDVLGKVEWNGQYDGTFSHTQNGVQLIATAAENFAVGSGGGRFSIAVVPNTTIVAVERFAIEENGTVIIASGATATDDQIKIAAPTGGAARFAGTILNADFTAARAFTLPDASGTFLLSTTATIVDSLQATVSAIYPDNTAFAAATTSAAGTATLFECVTQIAGTGAGNAVPALTTVGGGTTKCSATFGCTAAAGTTTTGTCASPALAAATRYEMRFGATCTTNPAIHCTAKWTYP